MTDVMQNNEQNHPAADCGCYGKTPLDVFGIID